MIYTQESYLHPKKGKLAKSFTQCMFPTLGRQVTIAMWRGVSARVEHPSYCSASPYSLSVLQRLMCQAAARALWLQSPQRRASPGQNSETRHPLHYQAARLESTEACPSRKLWVGENGNLHALYFNCSLSSGWCTRWDSVGDIIMVPLLNDQHSSTPQLAFVFF